MNSQCAECQKSKNEKHFETVELFIFKAEFKICKDCKYQGLILEN